MILRWIRACCSGRSSPPPTAGAAPGPGLATPSRAHWPAELALALQDAREPSALAQALFLQLQAWVPLQQATLYGLAPAATGAEPVLRLLGGYGTADAPDSVALGEGLLGQCAQDRRTLCLDPVPAGYWRVASGTGQAPARALLLLPIERQGQLLGVVELASLDRGLAREQAALEALMPVLGARLDALPQLVHGAVPLAWHAALLDTLPEALLVFDDTGVVRLANPAALQLFGVNADGVLGQAVRELLPDTPLAVSASVRLPLTGWPRSGPALALDAVLAPVPAREGQPPGVCALLRLPAPDPHA